MCKQYAKKMECALLNAQIREVFHKWDCSLIESDELFAELQSLGLEVSEAFMVLIENHKRIRNIPYSAFLKALKFAQAQRPVSHHPSSASNLTSSRLMNAVIFRETPVSSSAKAPFGTDNNMFSRPARSQAQPLTAELISNTIPVERKRMGPMSGVFDVFKETVTEDFENLVSEAVPRHLKSTLNPITGECDDDTESLCSIKRRAQEDHGDILSWSPEEAVMDPLPPYSRRHYPPAVMCPEEPPREPPLEAFIYARNFSKESPISHQLLEPTIQGTPRRLMKSVATKPLSFCPFATDTDDLEAMRRLIRQKPLGSVFAPPPTAA